MEKKRVLTGHRPTGPRHIGHLVGTLESWVQLQDQQECIFLIADLHVLTTGNSSVITIQQNIQAVLADWLAAGIDPQRAAIVLQSALPAHAQLALLLSMLTSVARASRIPTYKEQVRELGLKPSLGLLTYPILQSADILLYKASCVPVGEDQLPHIELAREVARHFNQRYGDTFPEPEASLTHTARLPGIDNRTMHTSYGNAIFLSDTPEETEQKVMKMYTDPNRVHATDPGRVEGNPLFDYLDIFHVDKAEVNGLKDAYRAGQVGDVEIKHLLSASLNEYLAPLRDRRAKLITQRELLKNALYNGTQKVKPLAQATIEEVYRKMGLLHTGLFKSSHPPNLAGAFC